MAKTKLTLSAPDDLKDNLLLIGEDMLKRGIDVRDYKKGGISISRVVEVLTEQALGELRQRDPT